MSTDTRVPQVDEVIEDARQVTVPPPFRTVPTVSGDGPHRGRLVAATVIAVIAVIAVLGAALVVGFGGDTPDLDRANEAATARLELQADQYEQLREARAERAATARLDALADVYAQVQGARSQQAATARLEALAEQYTGGQLTRGQQAAADRLARLAEAVTGE